MTMPASLMGFGIFRLLKDRLELPFSPVENVLVQTVAGSMAIMPLGCGFVGVVPAMEFLMREEEGEQERRDNEGWRRNVRLLLGCFVVSGLATLATYFFPVLRNIPIFGSVAAGTWLWTLNPSLAYVGQGIIMGPATTLHMLLGAVVGWGILSPLAKYQGWAPGPVGDWEHGSKGWIVWVSLAIMLADSIVSLGHLALRSSLKAFPAFADALRGLLPGQVQKLFVDPRGGYSAVVGRDGDVEPDASEEDEWDDDKREELDAPPEQQISDRVVAIGLALSIGFCIVCIHIVFGDLVPLYAITTAVLMALVLSIMGVRALGETDLNPVSGISKLAQLFFAFIIPQSNKSSVLINLVAGAVSEAGALQAGDLMQDIKTGHLLGAPPKAQFWGQVIGAAVGSVVSAFIYKLYTAVYTIPGDLFQVPTGYVWIFTARLVTGEGLPRMAREWAIGSAALFASTTALRIFAADKRWQALIPGGIAVAVGMYNVPSFTLARTIGGLLAWWWRFKGWQDTPLIVLASGFILGEGFLSIANLVMQSAGVPHF
ncbi:hypothetical protein OQA88_12179 [Cercophora sp. LCS_1]